MNLVSQYVLRVGAYMIFSVLLETITPNGNSKKMIKLMISLIFMYVLIQPVFEWIRQEVPLEQLTTAEIQWDEMENAANLDYEKQAWNMVGEGYEQVFMERGLPKDLQKEYSIVEIQVDDTVEVILSRNGRIGDFENRSFQFGQIGTSQEEEEILIRDLSEYWGIQADQLEMKLR